MRKKSPSSISEEELLKILEELDDEMLEDSQVHFDNSVLAFVQNFRLSPGKDRIVKKQLYNLYRVWNKGLAKLSQTAFTLELSKYFEHKGNFYLVNTSLFTIADFIQKERAKRQVDKSKSKHWHQHFTTFLQATELEEGTYYIELEIIHYLYVQWRQKNRKKSLLSRKQFIKLLDLYFEVRDISHGQLWVGCNEQIKNLVSKQEVERWRKTRAKDKKKFYYPKEEWKKFALYWEEKSNKKE